MSSGEAKAPAQKKDAAKKEKKPKAEGKKVKKDKPAAAEEKREAPKAKSGAAIVKAVLSGDTLILMGGASPTGQVAPEKQVTLSGITAPKFARGSRRSEKDDNENTPAVAGDEAWGWHSREFLRKLLIGQKVNFVSYFAAPSANSDKDKQNGGGSGRQSQPREYCTLTFGADNVNVSQIMVKNGWARVKPSNKPSKNAERDELLKLEEAAKAAKLGVHNDAIDGAFVTRQVEWDPDARALFQKFKGHPLPAIVDQVRDGYTLRCELLLGLDEHDLRHSMITLYLAGIQCPRTPLPRSAKISAEEKRAREEEPYGLEAQQFTAARLLHRDVQVVIQGVDKFNNLFGTILFPKGNITLKLLEHGYAKVLSWSAAITPDAQRMKDAERLAKESRLKLWENYSPADEKTHQNKEYIAKVIEVPNGDTLVVEVEDSHGIRDVKRVYLASVRCQRVGGPGGLGEPLGWEARESVRKRLIGHRVKLLLEYVKEVEAKDSGKGADKAAAADKEEAGKKDGKQKKGDKKAADKKQPKKTEEREFVSVNDGKGNLSIWLVHNGYAAVIRHRKEEDRSYFYEELQRAEEQAIVEGKGMHSGAAAVHRLNDLTQRAAPETAAQKLAASSGAKEDKPRRSKTGAAALQRYLPTLQRAGQTPAVVEFVVSGTRFKVYEPTTNAMFFFALAGVRLPFKDDRNKELAALNETATKTIRNLLLHRDVTIRVEGVSSNNDTFIGSLWIGKENVSVKLLQEGFATFSPPNEQVQDFDELSKAQEAAQSRKLNIWEKMEVKEDAPEDFKAGEQFSIKVTNIIDASTFWFQNKSDGSVAAVEEKLATFDHEAALPVEDLRSETLAAGLWEVDGGWHRVRLDGPTKEKDVRVFFVDYGNRAFLKPENLKQLPEDLAQLPKCAKVANLSGVRASKRSNLRSQSMNALNDLVGEHELQATVDAVTKGREGRDSRIYLSVTDDKGTSINSVLLEQGWVKINKKSPKALDSIVQSLKAAQDQAKENQVGLWEYYSKGGDDDSSEEEEDARGGGRGRGGGGRRGPNGRPRQQR